MMKSLRITFLFNEEIIFPLLDIVNDLEYTYEDYDYSAYDLEVIRYHI